MYLRAASIALISLLVAACDPATREVSVEKEAGQPGIPAQYMQGRSGMVILAGQSYPFTIQTCAIGGAGGEADFMVIGEGLSAEGELIGIHADGNPNSVAVLVRRQNPKAIVAHTYRSQFKAADVRVDNQTISGSGAFLRASTGESIPGEFSASCGRAG